MTRARGQMTKSAIDAGWPHQVEISGRVVSANFDAINAFCQGRSLAPQHGRRSYRDDEDHLRYCFAIEADADAFAARFGGRRVTVRRKGLYVFTDEWLTPGHGDQRRECRGEDNAETW